MNDRPRANKEIGDAQVLVIDQHGASLGLMHTGAALRMAANAGFDLVEVAPATVPSICKLVIRKEPAAVW